ncbi:MAG: hypothetical protein NTZ50_16465 [Chloroflexi bacterium]|nr:hypothetical protein [Chloroflexota bacterium]
MKHVVVFVDATSEHEQILLINRATRQRFAMVRKMQEIARRKMKLRRAFAVVFLVAIVLQIEEMKFAVMKEGDEIRSPAIRRFVEDRHIWSGV